MANVDVITLLETNRQLLAQVKQAIIANDKTGAQALMTTVGTNATTINNAISAASNVSLLDGISS